MGHIMKILAVDDDENILRLLEAALEAVDFPGVETASGPEQALARLGDGAPQFDCFLLDIQMPVMDGIELCERIRSMPAYRKTPIVMLTAMSDREYIDRAFAVGATDYVTKPFDILELGTRMRMAERLHLEIRSAATTQDTLERMVENLNGKQRFPLESPIEVEDIDRFLPLRSFQNYVATLGRGKYYASNMMAVEITNIKQINDRCTPKDFVYAITDYAEAISDSLAPDNLFFTYFGSGIFICIYNRVRSTISDDLAFQMQDRIAEMGLVCSDGAAMVPLIRCGKSVSPGFFSGHGNLDVIGRAVASLGSPPDSAELLPEQEAIRRFSA